MDTLLLVPPIAFLIFLGISFGMMAFSRFLTAKGKDTPGKTKSYACGETVHVNRAQPEYAQFYKFAFFFTIMHVVVLIVATDPMGISALSALYLAVAVLSLFLLLRR